MKTIVDEFQPMLGLPCWQARQGHGSFLTLEFGAPEVIVGDARSRQMGDPAEGRTPTIVRTVTLRGEWHLWIYMAEWSLTIGDRELAHSESDRRTIHYAIRILEGQRLSSVDVSNTDASAFVAFDLGCTLSTRPVERHMSREPDEQWMLYQPSGQVLTVRADGRYEQKPGDSSSEPSWLPIP